MRLSFTLQRPAGSLQRPTCAEYTDDLVQLPRRNVAISPCSNGRNGMMYSAARELLEGQRRFNHSVRTCPAVPEVTRLPSSGRCIVRLKKYHPHHHPSGQRRTRRMGDRRAQPE